MCVSESGMGVDIGWTSVGEKSTVSCSTVEANNEKGHSYIPVQKNLSELH